MGREERREIPHQAWLLRRLPPQGPRIRRLAQVDVRFCMKGGVEDPGGRVRSMKILHGAWVWGSGWSVQVDAGFCMNRATGPGPSAARTEPAGVCSLLGRAGEARSGFCREVKR